MNDFGEKLLVGKSKAAIAREKNKIEVVPLRPQVPIPDDPLAIGNVFKSLIKDFPTCGACATTLKDMNDKGVQHVVDNREKYEAQVIENAKNRGWYDKLTTAWAAMKLGIQAHSIQEGKVVHWLFDKAFDICENGYPKTENTCVTSFNPFRRIPRQNWCVSRWSKLGCKVVAVQAKQEIDQCKSLFPFVDEWVESKEERGKVGIHELVNAPGLSDRFLLLNSDIEIRQKPDDIKKTWFAGEGLRLGYRWNHIHGAKIAREEPAGIDVFSISKRDRGVYNNCEWKIGIPMWDWDLPWQFYRSGVKITCMKEPVLFHELHDLGWTEDEMKATHVKFIKMYDTTPQDVSKILEKIRRA